MIHNQFNCTIKVFQSDNGGEFKNSSLNQFFSNHGVQSRYTCPHTSQQNGHAERMIRTVTNMVRSLLSQANLSPSFWVEALHVASHLLNSLPIKTLQELTPHEALYRSSLSYSHHHVFGCLCYPNVSATSPYKLAPSSLLCIFLGYPSSQKRLPLSRSRHRPNPCV